MRLLVIGGCGFVGRNFIRYVLQHYGPEMVTNMDALTTGNLANTAEFTSPTYDDRYEFVHAALGDADRLEAVIAKHQYFAIIYFAGESCDPMDTQLLLAAARRHGVRRFVLVSSEYEDETSIAAEGAVLAAFDEHGQEIVITRATENYGPFQSLSGFIPGTILHALRDEPIPVCGDGMQARDWLHVDDHCAALFTALLEGRAGIVYQLATGRLFRDLDVAHRILGQLGKDRDLVKLQAPAEARVAHHGASTVESLRWKSRHPFEDGLRETVEWYVRNRAWWESFLDQ